MNQKNLIHITTVIPNTHFFVYREKQFPFNFDVFNFTSKFFSGNAENSRNRKYIQLLSHDEESNIDISDESINTFISYVQREAISIDDDNVLSLNYLGRKYQINELIECTKRYITEHQSNLVLEILSREANQNDNFKDMSTYEEIVSENFLDYINDSRMLNLPIHTIYRIFRKYKENKHQQKNQHKNKDDENDQIFDFLIKCLDKYGRSSSVLFSELEADETKSQYLNVLLNKYSKCFDFHFLNSNLMRMKYEQENENLLKSVKIANDQNETIANLTKEIEQLKKNQEDQTKIINELKTKLEMCEKEREKQTEINNDFEEQKKEIIKIKEEQSKQKEVVESNKNQLDNLNDETIKKLVVEIENLKKEIGKQKEDFKQFEKTEKEKWLKFSINGQIVASVKNGLLISAKINLLSNEKSLDTTRSKYIISTSNAEILGIDAYEKGEPITSTQMDTVDFLCKPGTYYVRCITFSSQGISNEIVSNPVTTSGSSISFQFEGKPAKVSLFKGKYKLEVWGAKGGNSTGKKNSSNPPGVGGLGGYSSGILNLKENEIVYVFVGGQGQSANSSEGATTDGGFPDGGGTKTGHYSTCTSVPGTGGGSTSIRIASNTDYARVIVAGGGGGASGCCEDTNSGGFGGGLRGGDCIYEYVSSKHQGAGTQTGSTCGIGLGSDGDPGSFGHGATGKYMQGCDSGGGGGGGWYGGGSGGYGSYSRCSSGGGGSGWTFTVSSFSTWQQGDSTNSSKFLLDNSYHLTDAVCMSGDQNIPRPDGNGTEKGHSGNGFAKITPE